MKLCPNCTTGYHDRQVTCPVHGVVLSEIRELRPGLEIRGTYRILERRGKGGMGVVYRAFHMLMEQERALKFLSADWAEDEAFKARFRHEVKTLRRIRHKNVIDCGDLERAEDDSLFFPMEFVDGPDLWDFLRKAPRPFDVELALTITRGIAEGLGAAHALGMVHRDIKPENILMAKIDEAWVPKIADFGIAATKENRGERARTKTGKAMMSGPYAAPEQWLGVRAAELDGRTDLYALGGVLYEMLTCRTAFDAENYEGWADQHKNVPPSPPSSLRPELENWRGLDKLVLDLLAKNPADRPKDAAETLNRLAAVQFVTPRTAAPAVLEQPETHRQTAAELIDPHALGAKESPPRGQPNAAQSPCEQFGVPRVPKPKMLEQPKRPTKPTREASPSPKPKPLATTSQGGVPGFGPAMVVLVSLTLVSIALWAHQWFQQPSSRTLEGHTGAVISLAFSPDGRTLASGSRDKTIKVWDAASGLLLRTLGGQSDEAQSVTFSPDGRTLAATTGDETVKLWDTATGQLQSTLAGNGGLVESVAFTPDGHTLASGNWNHTVKLWDVSTGRLLRTLDNASFNAHTGTLVLGSPVLSLAFSPDGRTLWSAGSSRLQRWDTATGQVFPSLYPYIPFGGTYHFSPDCQIAAHVSSYSSNDNNIALLDTESGQLLRTLVGNKGPVNSVAFTPDGRKLASGSTLGAIQMWDAATGKPLRMFQGHARSIHSVAFSPDGRTLASGGDDNTIKLWDVSGIR